MVPPMAGNVAPAPASRACGRWSDSASWQTMYLEKDRLASYPPGAAARADDDNTVAGASQAALRTTPRNPPLKVQARAPAARASSPSGEAGSWATSIACPRAANRLARWTIHVSAPPMKPTALTNRILTRRSRWGRLPVR